MMYQYQPIVCPIDGRDDTIAKVSAVYRAGVPSEGGMKGFSIDTGGTLDIAFRAKGRQTALNRLLAPPEPPHRITKSIGFLWLTTVMFFAGALIIWLTPAHPMPPDKELQTALPFLLITGIPGMVALLVSFALFIWQQVTYSANYAKWRRAKERWNMMYYCAKHDVVFVPGEPAHSIEEGVS
ncbi:MAG TPA: hypothetical protein VKQ36_10440 [Ktedonobacterales bacterium]|nr:hypothetical protein [Ktedonobacterales bacterium]